ncbi:hypothetical protein INT45_004202 [Circinella minor]|uniref:Uncharacterized protein n=1 Tax=Circinella minor TaxID=1195481 RepID=A0A8H7VH95_9FUNG|nr:hypothetical protein INT45_004202 [Circinella minor]
MIPTHRSLLRVVFVTTTLFNISTFAVPLEQQQHFVVSSSSSSPTNTMGISNNLAIENSLSEYYKDIVDQVMESVTESIFASASHSFMTVRHYQVSNHDDHLTLVRSNLLASVRPLVQSDLQVILPMEELASSSELTLTTRVNRVVIHLNQRLAEQLGHMINVDEATDKIIRQSLVDNRYLAHCTGQKSAQLQLEQLLAALTSFFNSPKKTNQSVESSSVVIEQQHKKKPRHRSIETNEAVLMSQWLHSWLSEIPGILTIEFDKRMHEAVQSVLEDF